MKYLIKIEPRAQKVIAQFQYDLQLKLVAKIKSLQFNPIPSGVVKLQSKHNLFRLRVGPPCQHSCHLILDILI